MEPVEFLLSDSFVEFSKKIVEIAEQKKRLKAEFKVVYDKFQSDLKELENAAMTIQNEFEEWKKSVTKKAD